MVNQDILFERWMKRNEPTENVTLESIGGFARRERNYLNSRSGRQVTPSGLNYAVLKFILKYCTPFDWPENLWKKFEKAKDPYEGNYAIWKKYPNIKVDIVDRPPSEISYAPEESIGKEEVEDVIGSISFERDLHEFIVSSLDTLEEGLCLYEGGNELTTKAGKVDILAIDSNEDLAVIEIKQGKARDRAIGQMVRYLEGVESEIAEPNQEVRGIIIAQDFSDKLKYSAKRMPELELKKYRVKFEFENKEF